MTRSQRHLVEIQGYASNSASQAQGGHSVGVPPGGGGPDVTAPTITSSNAVNQAENSAFTHILTANEVVTWTKTGGADQALFTLVGNTLSMTAKDFEAPIDAGANNTYVVQVTATDEALNATNQTITVTVTDVDDTAPLITSSNAISLPENDALALTLTADEVVTWTKTGGADQALFTLIGSTLSMTAKDFEVPLDVGGNNTYVVQVTATDAALNATNQTITVTVTDVGEASAPIIADAPFNFGAKTLDGAGGVPLPNSGGAITSAAIIGGNTGTDWKISAGGVISPNQSGGLTAGPYALIVTATNANGTSPPATITITTSGLDDGRDLALSRSVANIAELLAAVTAQGTGGGDPVLLRGGNYGSGTLFQNHLTVETVIAPHAGAVPVFNTIVAGIGALDLRRTDFITLDGLTFATGTQGAGNGSANIIQIRDTSHDIVVQNCIIGGDPWAIDASMITALPNRANGIGSDGTTAPSDVIIRNNIITNTWVPVSFRCAGDCLVEGNVLDTSVTDIVHMAWVEGITSTIIRDNYITGVSSDQNDVGGPHGDLVQISGYAASGITDATWNTGTRIRMGWPGLVIERNVVNAKYARAFEQGIFIGDMGPTSAGQFTISVASPCVVSCVEHGAANDTPIMFSGSAGTSPPAPLVNKVAYYARNVTADTMELALTPGGASINTTAPQVGTISMNIHWYEDPIIKGNLVINGPNETCGIKVSGANNLTLIGNTVANHPFHPGAASISLMDVALLGNTLIQNNVADDIEVAAEFAWDDINNVVLGLAGATIPYADAFVGPDFSVTDREDVIAAWTNKPNGPLDIDGSGTGTVGDVGAGSGYVTWATTSPGNDGSLDTDYEVIPEMAKINNYFNVPTVNHMIVSSGARANVPLNAAYVHGVSGPSAAIRYQARSLDPITEFYVFMDAHGGTLGNISMQCDIYNEHASSVTQPGSTLRDSSTACAMPAADDMWIKFTFGTPYTPSAVGEVLWFVPYNTAAAPTVDFPNIMTSTNSNLNPVGISHGFGYTATAGFSAAGTTVSKMPFALKQGAESYGRAFTQSSAAFYASNQLKRGIRFTPPVDISVVGAFFFGPAVTLDGIAIFADGTAPGGAALHTFSLDSDANLQRSELIGSRIWAPITLSGGVTYKAVVTFDANATSPSVNQIEDYASYAAFFDDMYDDFVMCGSCIDDGASGWTLSKAACPQLALIIEEYLP